MLLSVLETQLRETLPMGRIEAQSLPGCPEITLGLINADFPDGPLPPEVMHQVIARPAYWAFCWGSGLALARYLLDHPDFVADKEVLDLGSGSGVVGIAAALAGARRVVACDNDPQALRATAVNAQANGVDVELREDLTRAGRGFGLLLMADVLYDASNLGLLAAAADVAEDVLIADSRIATLPDPRYQLIATVSALTFPNLGEFDEFGSVRLFQRKPGISRFG